MKITYFKVALLCLCTISIMYSQTTYRKITSDEYNNELVKSAVVKTQRDNIEKLSKDYKKAPKFKKVILPVVFHVLYKPGTTYPTEAQVLSQLDALNRDFDKKNYKTKHKADSIEKFKDKVSDTEIQFCLAAQDPNGTNSKGINFISTNISGWGNSQDVKLTSKGGQNVWNADKYINIWVADLGENTSGYAQMPGGPKETDGIVIDYKYFGQNGTAVAPYNQGKTLTHLIGNYLNLYDLWGPCYCCDDEIEDTPVHNAPNYGKTDEYRHVSLCLGTGVELSMNFMDNTDDDWMYMFTAGQKLRMQASLSDNGPRATLVNNNTSCKKNLEQLENRNMVLSTISIFPNPTNGAVNFNIETNNSGSVQLIAVDQMGRIVKSEKITVVKGVNNYKWDANGWAAGIYTIKAISTNTNAEQKLIIY